MALSVARLNLGLLGEEERLAVGAAKRQVHVLVVFVAALGRDRRARVVEREFAPGGRKKKFAKTIANESRDRLVFF